MVCYCHLPEEEAPPLLSFTLWEMPWPNGWLVGLRSEGLTPGQTGVILFCCHSSSLHPGVLMVTDHFLYLGGVGNPVM